MAFIKFEPAQFLVIHLLPEKKTMISK